MTSRQRAWAPLACAFAVTFVAVASCKAFTDDEPLPARAGTSDGAATEAGEGGDASSSTLDGGEAGVDAGGCTGTTPLEGPEPVPTEPVACGDAGLVSLLADARHCGACGHDCLGAACVSGTCAPEVVADLSGALPDAGVALVSADPTTLLLVAAPGTPSARAVAVPRSGTTGGDEPSTLEAGGIVRDAVLAGDAVYAAVAGQSIAELDRAGKKPRVLVDGIAPAAVAAVGDAIFFTDGVPDGGLGRVLRDGGAAGRLVTGVEAPVELLATDDAVFFTSAPRWFAPVGGPAAILRVTREGGDLARSAPVEDVSGLAVDDTWLYFVVGERHQLRRLPRRGPAMNGALGEVVAVFGEDERHHTHGLAADGTYVYALYASTWDDDDAVLVRVPRCGGAPFLLARTRSRSRLVVDGAYVLWGTSSGAVLRVPR